MSRKSPPEMQHVVERRRRRVAARDAHEVDVADRARGDRVANRLVRRVEAPVEADLEEDAGTPRRPRAPRSTSLEVERDRLLAEDRLAGRRRRDDQRRRGCRCSCRSRPHRRRADSYQLLGGRRGLDAELARRRVARCVGVDVVDGRERRPATCAGEQLGVHARRSAPSRARRRGSAASPAVTSRPAAARLPSTHAAVRLRDLGAVGAPRRRRPPRTPRPASSRAAPSRSRSPWCGRPRGRARRRPRAPRSPATASARQPSARACATQSTRTVARADVLEHVVERARRPGRPAAGRSPRSRRCRRATTISLWPESTEL